MYVYSEVEAKGVTDRLNEEDVYTLVGSSKLTQHTDRHGAPGLLAFWLSDDSIAGIEFQCGDSVRVKTQGDGPFVCKYTSEQCTVV